MTENHPPEAYNYEDMIDLRALIKTFWKHKWFIIGTAFLAALAAFLVSEFLRSPKYEVSAQIGIRRETFFADFEPSIENPSGLEDYSSLSDLTSSLPQLAEAEDVLLNVCVVMELVCTGENSERPDVEAEMLGNNQLRLTVGCESPQRCADFANAWAEEVIKRWNTLYGNEAIDLDQLVSDVENARNNLESAQASLESYLPESRVKVVETQLEQARHELYQSLLDIEKNKRIVQDANALDARLASLAQNSELSLGDALSLIALQQRSTGEISGTQFQLPDEALMGSGYSVAAARASIGILIASLKQQNVDIESSLPSLESTITQLALTLENESYQINRLILERDRAEKTYKALAGHLDEITLNLRYQGKSAYLLAQARVPNEEIGFNLMLYMALAGMVGVFLAISGVLFVHWWSEDD